MIYTDTNGRILSKEQVNAHIKDAKRSNTRFTYIMGDPTDDTFPNWLRVTGHVPYFGPFHERLFVLVDDCAFNVLNVNTLRTLLHTEFDGGVPCPPDVYTAINNVMERVTFEHRGEWGGDKPGGNDIVVDVIAAGEILGRIGWVA